MTSLLLSLLCLIGTVLAGAADFVPVRRSTPTDPAPLKIMLRAGSPSAAAELSAAALDHSRPHWTLEQTLAVMRPRAADVACVDRWLAERALSAQWAPENLYADVSTTVADVARIYGNLPVFEHAHRVHGEAGIGPGVRMPRVRGHVGSSVPAGLAQCNVDLVVGGVDFHGDSGRLPLAARRAARATRAALAGTTMSMNRRDDDVADSNATYAIPNALLVAGESVPGGGFGLAVETYFGCPAGENNAVRPNQLCCSFGGGMQNLTHACDTAIIGLNVTVETAEGVSQSFVMDQETMLRFDPDGVLSGIGVVGALFATPPTTTLFSGGTIRQQFAKRLAGGSIDPNTPPTWGTEYKIANTLSPLPPVNRTAVLQQYGIDASLRGSQASGNSQAFLGFAGQFFAQSDVDMFMQSLDLPQQNITLHGLDDQSNPGGEATLDAEMMVGFAPGVPTEFWSVEPTSANATALPFFLSWLQEAQTRADLPKVMSVSYGLDETTFTGIDGQLENPLPWAEYIAKCELIFSSLGARGSTVLIASGDSGASGIARLQDTCPGSVDVQYPAMSPWVVSVASTVFTTMSQQSCWTQPLHMPFEPTNLGVAPAAALPASCGPSGRVGEISASMSYGRAWTATGGFSSMFPTPKWQEQAVAQYLAKAPYLPDGGWYNSSGRMYPDFAVVGDPIYIIEEGTASSEAGTSASTPMFAALLSLVNENRMANGKSSLGFMTDRLYTMKSANSAALNDVSVGDDRCGIIDPTKTMWCCGRGFHSAAGVADAVTGVGSIGDFSELIKELSA